MPVHRHLHDRMGSVYASRAELDAWVRSRNLQATQESGNNTSLPNSAKALRAAFWTSVTEGILLALTVVELPWRIVAILWVQKTEYFWRNPIADARIQAITDFDGTGRLQPCHGTAILWRFCLTGTDRWMCGLHKSGRDSSTT